QALVLPVDEQVAAVEVTHVDHGGGVVDQGHELLVADLDATHRATGTAADGIVAAGTIRTRSARTTGSAGSAAGPGGTRTRCRAASTWSLRARVSRSSRDSSMPVVPARLETSSASPRPAAS